MDIKKQQKMAEAARLRSMSEKELEELVNRAYSYVLVAHTISNSADILIRKANEILAGSRDEMRQRSKQTAGRIIRQLEGAMRQFEAMTAGEKGTDQIFFEVLGAQSYDAIRNNAYEVVRFLMLFYARACSDPKATAKLGAYMQRMKSNGIFSEEEIAEFRMK